MGGPWWLWARRGGLRRGARRLSDEESAVLRAYFAREVLDAARLAVVERVENPWVFRVLRRCGVRVPVDLTGVWGMCFGDVVAVTSRAMDERGLSTVFHELVHTVQMRRVGVGAFCRAYVRDYVMYGYMGIAFEEEAFALQARFERGEVFEVG